MSRFTLDPPPIADRGANRVDRNSRRAYVVLGVGLGAFVDGIVLHQILQWHHLVSADGEHDMRTVAGLEANTLADGLFHLAALALTVTGIVLLVRAGRSARQLGAAAIAGSLLVGWGAFNLVEGIVDHHVLTVHHVRDDVADPTGWDLAFLIVSAAILAAGLLLSRERNATRAVPSSSPRRYR